MSKLAIFVEGLTEQLFVAQLIREVAGVHKVRISMEQIRGKLGDRRITLQSVDADTGQPGFVLIRNCFGDHNVGSDVRDQYDSLVRSDFKAIIGLRDLYPRAPTDMPILLGLDRRSLNFRLKTSPIRVKWIIAVMETEAWFLAEHTHFVRLQADLTIEKIQEGVGFDPSSEDMEARQHPAVDLDSIYRLVGLEYKKLEGEIRRTISVLDFVRMYTDMAHVKRLKELVDEVDKFVTTVAA